MADKRSWVDRIFGPDLTSEYETQLQESRGQVEAAGFEVTRMQESIRELSLYLEDLNWTRLEGWEQDKGFDKKVIEENADRLRALVAANPTIKKAINARFGYIWGRGVQFNTNASVKSRVIENQNNERVLFSEEAQWRLETLLATEGNIWALRNNNTNEVSLIPIEQITAWVTDEVDTTRVLYWLREYSVTVTNFATGERTTKIHQYFVPAHDTPQSGATNIDGIPIKRDYAIVHLAANRQFHWLLGLPDLLAAMFWTKAHKELFEAGTTFVKAQGKYAAKVIAKTGQGGQNAAATLRDMPRRNEATGEVYEAGGTAVLTGGLDMQLMGKMSGGVDFGAFDPVAGLIAAGLGLPLRVLLADSENADVSLEQSTVDEMVLRQKLWSGFFRALFGPKNKVDITWPKIKTEPEYRRIQSVEIANRTNALHPHELRKLTLEAFALEGDPNDIPDIELQPDVAIAKAKSKIDIAVAKATAKATADASGDSTTSVPEQGKDAKVGKLSTGSDAKASRDDVTDKNTKGQ
jgi:hypothetical protein